MEWERVKQNLGTFSATLVPSSGLIGLGTGSTSIEFIKALARTTPTGIQCVASSLETELIAKTRGLSVIDPRNWTCDVDVTFDGADAVDEEGTAIKGAGGALVREKIVAHASKRLVLMIDERKWKKPWQECLLPVAVIPFGLSATLRSLNQRGMKGSLRMHGSAPFLTNDGLFIVDIPLTFALHSLARLHADLKEIPGIAETGLFFHFASEIVIGYGDGKIEHRKVVV